MKDDSAETEKGLRWVMDADLPPQTLPYPAWLSIRLHANISFNHHVLNDFNRSF